MAGCVDYSYISCSLQQLPENAAIPHQQREAVASKNLTDRKDRLIDRGVKALRE